ncbi:MAG: DUF1385 domain-containing protein, partial [Clostridia bacterium]|nr:DUF1385 domain-containing protein [Clostridia bacterium]
TRILSAPGLWMQRITTKEPDDSMIEVAIVSVKSALHDTDFADFEIPYEPKEEEKTPEESAENTENGATDDDDR